MESEEKLEAIDDNFNVLGVYPRSQIRKSNLKHKTSLVIVKNSENQYYIHQRSENKEIYPLKWVVSAGGAVDIGETFEETAVRELKEELGIDASVKYLYDFEFESKYNNYKAKVYLAEYDGEVSMNPDECKQGKWASIDEIRDMIAKDMLCPDTAIFIEKYFKYFN
jgi:mutator protein MutT